MKDIGDWVGIRVVLLDFFPPCYAATRNGASSGLTSD